MNKRIAILLICIAIITGCATSPTEIPGAQTRQTNLLDDPRFDLCTTGAISLVSAGRLAMMNNVPKEQLLASVKNNAEAQEAINELFVRLQSGKLKYYGEYAGEWFYLCMDRRGLPLVKDVSGSTSCLARIDIPFFLENAKSTGSSKEEAVQRTSHALENRKYPRRLIELTADMVYRVKSPQESMTLNQFVFSSCLFPKEWDKKEMIR